MTTSAAEHPDMETLAIELRGIVDAVISMWDEVRENVGAMQAERPGLGYGPVHGLDWATTHLRDIAEQIYEKGQADSTRAT